MRLLVLPGDGIGPEIVGAALHVLAAQNKATATFPRPSASGWTCTQTSAPRALGPCCLPTCVLGAAWIW